jgi:hypothetical protein
MARAYVSFGERNIELDRLMFAAPLVPNEPSNRAGKGC